MRDKLLTAMGAVVAILVIPALIFCVPVKADDSAFDKANNECLAWSGFYKSVAEARDRQIQRDDLIANAVHIFADHGADMDQIMSIVLGIQIVYDTKDATPDQIAAESYKACMKESGYIRS
jgi:hypothetical protein